MALRSQAPECKQGVVKAAPGSQSFHLLLTWLTSQVGKNETSLQSIIQVMVLDHQGKVEPGVTQACILPVNQPQAATSFYDIFRDQVIMAKALSRLVGVQFCQ